MNLNPGFILAIVALAAFAAPLVADRIGIPVAVVEILLGLGLSLMVPAQEHGNGTFIASLGTLGFIILMFLVGVELDLRQIWSGSKVGILAGILFTAVSLLFSILVLGKIAGASPLWILSGAAVSVGIAAPVLSSSGLLGSKFGHDLIVMGSVSEVLYILFLNGYAVSVNHSLHTSAVLVGLRTAGIITATVLTGLVISLLRSRIPRHFQRWFRRDDPIQLGLRGTFLIMFFFVAVSSLVHIPDVLGALVAGVLFRTVMGNAKAIVERLSSIANSFFVPVFFITVGLNTVLRFGMVALLPRIGIVLVVLMVPRLTAIFYFVFLKHPLRNATGGSLLLMAPLTMLITTAELGVSENVLSQLNASTIVLTATLTGIVFPILARGLLPHAKEAAGGQKQQEQPAAV